MHGAAGDLLKSKCNLINNGTVYYCVYHYNVPQCHVVCYISTVDTSLCDHPEQSVPDLKTEIRRRLQVRCYNIGTLLGHLYGLKKYRRSRNIIIHLRVSPRGLY